MVQQARRPAGRATGGLLVHVAPAIAAEAGHDPPAIALLLSAIATRLRRVALPTAPGDDITRLHHRAWENGVFRRKGNEQGLVGGHVIEHSEEKLRLTRSRADGLWAEAAHRQEAAQPFGLGRDEVKRGDSERLGCRTLLMGSCRLALIFHFVFPHHRGHREIAVASCETRLNVPQERARPSTPGWHLG